MARRRPRGRGRVVASAVDPPSDARPLALASPRAAASDPASDPAPQPSERVAQRVAAAVAIVALAIHLSTLHPSLPGGDAGELAATACAGAVPHPPGYPLYAMLARAVVALPIAAPIVRLSALSAVTVALATYFVARASMAWTGRLSAGPLGGALFAFSLGVWSYATAAEVFGLHLAFVAALVHLAVAAARAPTLRSLQLFVLVAALAACHHHTVVFAVAPLLAFVARAVVRAIGAAAARRALGSLVALALLGLAPYAYLVVAARRASLAGWGDTTTLAGLARHVLRADYGTFQLAAGTHAGASFSATLRAFGLDALGATHGVGLALAAAGLALALLRPALRPVGAVAAGSLALYVVAFAALSNLPVEAELLRAVVARFWLHAQVFLALFGAAAVLALPARRSGRRDAALATAIAAVVALLLARGGPRVIAGDRGAVRALGAAVLESAPKDALVLTQGDLFTDATRYLQLCEGVRPDVVVLDRQLLTYPWANDVVRRVHPAIALPGARYGRSSEGGYDAAALVSANLARRPILMCGGDVAGDASLAGVFDAWPLGPCDRLLPRATPPALEAWLRESAAALPPIPAGRAGAEGVDPWERVAIDEAWSARQRRGFRLLVVAIEEGSEPRLLRGAIALLEPVVAEAPRPPPAAFKNLGIAWGRLEGREPQAHQKMLDALRAYLSRAPADDPDLPSIRAIVAAG